MSPHTVLLRWPRAARAPDPLWVFAALIVAGEAVLALVGVHAAALAAVALLAPGWALAPLLPAPLRRCGLARVAAGPALGLAVTPIALITISWLGIPLTGVSIRLVLVALVLVGLGSWDPSTGAARRRPSRSQVLETAGLLGALMVGLVLALRVVGGSGPIPGNDWAKYLLYADEIRRHGSMLIDNPFWMLGVPFREDPAIPSLYGSVLIMAQAPAAVLARGIVVLTLIEIGAAYALARAFWGRAAGVLCAFLLAVAPATQDILGWHGLANVGALALLALALAVLATFARDGLDRRGIVGAAIVLLGLAAAHRLSLLVALGTAALVLATCLIAARRHRREVLGVMRQAAWVLGLAVVLGIGVLADLYERQRTFGGTQGYAAYLDTKIDLGLAVRDVSVVLVVATVLALGYIAARRRGDRALWPPIAMLAVSVALGYVWILHVPNYYARMVFFVPLAAAPIVAAVAVRLRPRGVVAALAVVAVAFTASQAWTQAPKVREVYLFADRAALRGLGSVERTLRPGEVVVTDRCWSFLSTWLLRTRTLPAITPQDIQPKAELRRARQGQSVLDGTPAGLALARRLGVRYLLVDPTCVTPDGELPDPPTVGTLVYASPRLAVLRLPG